MKKITKNVFLFVLLFSVLPVSMFAQFEKGALMKEARMAHYQVLLDNGEVWLVGGHGTGFTSLGTAEIYDKTTKEFTLQSMKYTHDCGALVKMGNGKFLIAGGSMNSGIAPGYNTTEIYDPTTKTYTSTGAMTYSRTNCYGTELKSGKILIAGGWYNNNSLTYTEIYDPTSGTFTSNPPLVTPRANPMVLPTNDGGAVVFGGYEGFGAGPFYQSVEYYNPEKDSFSVLSNTLIPDEEGYYVVASRNVTEAFKTNDGCYIFIVNRITETDTEYVSLSFDPETKSFTSLYRMSIPSQSPFILIGATLNKDDNILVCMWQRVAIPAEIGVGTFNLTTNEMSFPTEWYQFSDNYYPGYAGLSMVDNNTLLMSGGHSATGYNTNFSPVDSTLLVTISATDVNDKKLGNEIPSKYELVQNYPNPFNPSTTISFSLPQQSNVKLSVYNSIGEEVAELLNENISAGNHQVNFDAANLSSGLYFYKIYAGNPSAGSGQGFVDVKKMLLLK